MPHNHRQLAVPAVFRQWSEQVCKLAHEAAKLWDVSPPRFEARQIDELARRCETRRDQFRYWRNVAAHAGKAASTVRRVVAAKEDISEQLDVVRAEFQQHSAFRHAMTGRVEQFIAERNAILGHKIEAEIGTMNAAIAAIEAEGGDDVTARIQVARTSSELHRARWIAKSHAEDKVLRNLVSPAPGAFDPVDVVLSLAAQAAEDVQAIDASDGPGRKPHEAQMVTVEEVNIQCADGLVAELRAVVGADFILTLDKWESANKGAEGELMAQWRSLLERFTDMVTSSHGGDPALRKCVTKAVRWAAADIGKWAYVIDDGSRRRVLDGADLDRTFSAVRTVRAGRSPDQAPDSPALPPP
jgi:hypothetical protein